MAERGIGGIRVEDLAAEAGVSPASVYSHFGTKDAVMAAMVERLLDLAEATLTRAYGAPGTAQERFQQIGLRFMDLLVDHPALARYLGTSGFDEPASALQAAVASSQARLRRGFEDAIQAVIDDGEMRPIDARLLSYSLFASWVGMASLRMRRDDMALDVPDVRTSVLQVSEILLAGLRPDGRAVSDPQTKDTP